MTKRLLIKVTLFIPLILVSATLSAREGNWDDFEKQVSEFRVQKQIPGLAIGVVHEGKLQWSKGMGFSDSNRTIPVTADTPFWIASVSKTFVGLAYLHLAAEGKIDLEEAASKTPNFDGICEWLQSSGIAFAEGLDCSETIKIRHILHHQVNSPPGSQFMYNPIMYSRLSRHLEHKFGQGIDSVEGRHNFLGQLIDEKILVPANMSRTMSSMWDRSKMAVYFDLADGFKVDERGYKTKLRRPDKHIAGGAGVVSTVNDLAKYEKALVQGDILPANDAEQLFQPAQFESGDTSPYGYGWYFQCYNGTKLMWHGGWDPESGYSALYLRVPSQKVALIALANSESGLWWGNSLTNPEVEKSDLARLFLARYLPSKVTEQAETDCSGIAQ